MNLLSTVNFILCLFTQVEIPDLQKTVNTFFPFKSKAVRNRIIIIIIIIIIKHFGL